MAKVVFLKPYLETDATWEMIRTSTYMGIWYMASDLKQRGHEVWYLDEVVRNNGIKRTKLYQTVLTSNNEYTEEALDISLEDYRKEKNKDFMDCSPHEFVQKYSAFRKENECNRVLAKTGSTIDETLQRISEIQPDYVCISLIASANYRAATKTGKAIKDAMPDVKIVFGGHHVSALSSEFIKDNPWVDHVIVGDGIEILPKIIENRLEQKVFLEGFKGLDIFPLLDYDIIKDTGYPRDQQYSYPSFGRKSVDFMFSKGCFRKCDFCVAGGQKGNKVTFIDWDKADEQLKLFKQHGIEEIIVQDDAFVFGDPQNLVKKLALMKKYGYFWQDSGGIDFELLDDFVTEQFIEYNKSGEGKLTGLYVPFNPRYWNKNDAATKTMVNKYERNFENLRRLREEGGIYVFTSQIVGTPECTRELVLEDIGIHKQMILDGYLDTALTLSATLLPGTKWYMSHSQEIFNINDVLGYSLFTTHHGTKNLRPQEIEELLVLRTKELNKIQKTYNWQTAFPNSVWDYID